MIYTKYPKSVIAQAELIKQICDDYWKNNVHELELQSYLLEWQSYGLFFDEDNRIYPSIIKIIGTKRLKLICKLLKYDLRT